MHKLETFYHKTLSRLSIETWKDIPQYKNLYKISNLGRVKSLKRLVNHPIYGQQPIKERILKNQINNYGYLLVRIWVNGRGKTSKIANLEALVFLNHKPNKTYDIVVDHKNNIRSDNNLYNIQLITNRLNCSKDTKGNNNYTGVTYNKRDKLFVARILINKKKEYLGCFKNEIDAAKAYQKRLKQLNE